MELATRLALSLLTSLLVAGSLPAAGEKEPRWGPVTDGLQAGLRVGDGRGKWRVGEDVPLALYLRNRTRSPLRLDYFAPPLIGWAPELRDAKGRPHHPEVGPLDYPVTPASITLNPGETRLFGETMLALRTIQAPPNQSPGGATLRGGPGRYSVSLPYRFTREEPGGWRGELRTGWVSFEVLPPQSERR